MTFLRCWTWPNLISNDLCDSNHLNLLLFGDEWSSLSATMPPLSLTLFSYIFFPNRFRFESTKVKTNFSWKWFLSGKKVGFKSRFSQLGSGLIGPV
ncbi:hypothetical protein Hanom_Chr04g00284051 [Helianthus anomalus]